jgi:predicted ATPase/class 3 adenylate cyclase
VLNLPNMRVESRNDPSSPNDRATRSYCRNPTTGTQMVGVRKVRLVETAPPARASATCPSCQADLPTNAKSCVVCGGPPLLACPTCRHLHSQDARFCSQCGARLPQIADAPDVPPLPSRAERRQLTVMFCDLVGSTLLAAQLDPEDMLEVIRSYQSVVSSTVQRFGGFIARNIGDGVLVYFGWPQADETDAERAVRAGLAVVEAVGHIPARHESLHARVGIASGLVVIGDAVSTGAAHEYDATGEAPNLAARLQAFAEPGSVVITESTRAQVGRLFDYDDLGALSVKGYSDPMHAWRVQGESLVQSRFEALRAPRTAAIIGRNEEVDLLMRRWRQASDGEGRVALISGDAGIGKSRLITALEERLQGEAYTRLRYFCAPHHQDTALYPITSCIERSAGFARRDTSIEKLRKLRTAMAPMDPSEEDVALFADLLSIPVYGSSNFNLSPQRKREKTFEGLSRQLDRIAAERPVLMIFEDAHWSDPTTLELLDLSINQILRLPVLLIVTFRPDFYPRWVGRAGVSLITLSRLDRNESAALVAQFASGDTLPYPVIDKIVAESDGVPLFIEELTKGVLDSPTLLETERLAGPASMTVPATLQASLMSRLDRIPAAKEVAQIGSVIGREFSNELLSAIAQMPEAAVRQGLNYLVTAELVSQRGIPPDAVYTFKHALIQDTAYESLVRSRRAIFHARLVQAMLARVPDVEEIQPGLLGHHCAQAGLIEKAASYFRRAGEKAAERAALAETRGQLERGLSLARTLPNSTARRTLEIELKLALGRVLLSTKGSAVAEAGEVFGEAVAMCRDLDRTELLTRALWGYWFNQVHRRDLTSDANAAQELLGVARRQNDTAGQMVAHAMLGITRFWQGRFEQSRLDLQTANELCRANPGSQHDLAIVSTHLDNHVRMQLSLALTCLGHLEQAVTEGRLAMQSALALPHLPTRAIVIAANCRHHWFLRDDEKVREAATALVAMCEEQAFPFYLALGRSHLGCLEAKMGRIDAGMDLLRLGLEGLHSIDATIWEPYILGMMAEAHGWAGNAIEARRLLNEALDLSTLTGGAWFDAELHRRKGEALLIGAKPDPQLAEACFRQSIAVAQGQSARLWELRASTSLARLWSRRGKRAEARALLAPVYAWFAKGDDIPDLRDAAALLAE